MSDNLSKVKRAINEILGVKEDEIQLESHLVNDLGADSIDLIELVMCIEEDFEIEITDEDAEKLNTVQDILTYLSNTTA